MKNPNRIWEMQEGEKYYVIHENQIKSVTVDYITINIGYHATGFDVVYFKEITGYFSSTEVIFFKQKHAKKYLLSILERKKKSTMKALDTHIEKELKIIDDLDKNIYQIKNGIKPV